MDVARTHARSRSRWLYGGGAVVAALVFVFVLARLKPSAPTIERGSAWIDVVRRGDLIRDVHAQGTLVPEHIRIVSAVAAGRVERLPVRPGEMVNARTIIVELSNPDLRLEALQARQSVTEAEGAMAALRTSLAQQRLNEEATLSTLSARHQQAARQLHVQEGLRDKGLGATNDLAASRDSALDLETHVSLQRRRIAELERARGEQLHLAGERINRLGEIVGEENQRLASMRVVAGDKGVLQTLGSPPLEVGQWVNSGIELARVSQPGRLKALLHVPEISAKDVTVGQRATIDTRTSVISGQVLRTDPSISGGTVAVEVAFDAPLAADLRADLSVDGTILLERVPNTLVMRRPANSVSGSATSVFRIEPNTGFATRVSVQLGRVTDTAAQVVSGLASGDSVIVSDAGLPAAVSRVPIK